MNFLLDIPRLKVYVDRQYMTDGQGQGREEAYLFSGRYWCTIDYYDGGFAQDPEQHKTSNIILGDKGGIYILPNNYCLFRDDHFTKKSKNLTYKRNSKYYIK